MSKVTDKSWAYLKRAHFHANGMGAASLALIVVMSFLKRYNVVRVLTALGLGIGAMGYSLFWMFAGMIAPGLGSTGLAKESLIWLALPSVAIFISGTLSVIVIFLLDVLNPQVGSSCNE